MLIISIPSPNIIIGLKHTSTKLNEKEWGKKKRETFNSYELNVNRLTKSGVSKYGGKVGQARK